MVLAILPALLPDIPALFAVYFDAFAAEPMGRLMLDVLFPAGTDSAEFREAHAKGTLEWWTKSTTQHAWKCVDTQTGEIVGMCLADVYLTPRGEEERANGGVPWLEGRERERAEAVLGRLWDVRERLFGGRPYVYTHVIAVDPKHQGRKAGALWCTWGIETAERLQLPLYFEASPSTVGLYEKVGFERLKESVVHPAAEMGTEKDIEVPLMVKMPASLGMSFEEWLARGKVDEAAAGADAEAKGGVNGSNEVDASTAVNGASN